MKTDVSLSRGLLRSADSLARRLGVTRSRLIATAVADYVTQHRDGWVTDRLNTVYASEDSRLDLALGSSQERTLRLTEW